MLFLQGKWEEERSVVSFSTTENVYFSEQMSLKLIYVSHILLHIISIVGQKLVKFFISIGKKTFEELFFS